MNLVAQQAKLIDIVLCFAMADPAQDARKDEELRELNRRFEDILKRCEVQPKEDGDSFPDWYRRPEQGIPTWLSQESPLTQQQQQPDRLASVVASFEWPSRGGFNWSVCLPTSGK